jgi:hypothetical protein
MAVLIMYQVVFGLAEKFMMTARPIRSKIGLVPGSGARFEGTCGGHAQDA